MKQVYDWLYRPLVITVGVMTAGVIVSIASGALLLYQQAERAMHHEVRQSLMRLARVAALHVNGDQHLRWKPGVKPLPPTSVPSLHFAV
ncbi:MAG: hypothetical protein ACUVSV_12920 [Armatimonadota bacterium]